MRGLIRLKGKERDMKKETKIVAGVLAVAVLLFLLFSASVMLKVAERAVVFNRFSGEIKRELQQGFNIVNPITDAVTVYDLRITRDDFQRVDGLSSDMQTIYLDIVINWKLDPEKLIDIYKTIKGNIKETIMNNAVIDTSKAELGKFRIDEIARNRENLKAAIESALRTRLKEKYIDIVNVSIVNVDYSDAYERAIEAKLIAEQKALEAKNQKEQARFFAEAKAIENQNLASTITPLVLKQKWIEKWDGKLPVYMLGENTNILLDIPK